MRRPPLMVNAGHILVATDFAPASARAIETASALAADLDADLTVVHGLEPAPYVERSPDEVPPAVHQALGAALATARSKVARAQAMLRVGMADDQILAAAVERGADLIVLGTHGRRGFRRAWFGSVAESVVRRSGVPVMTVHAEPFVDRAHGGRALALAVEPLRASRPVLLAISRGGIVVGAEVARVLGVSMDVLFTRPLLHLGAEIGGACEDGSVQIDPRARQSLDVGKRDDLIARARCALDDDVAFFRGARWIQDPWRRTVLLVSDEVAAPWRSMAAAQVVARMEPDRIVVAAPVTTAEAVAALELANIGAVTVHLVDGPREARAAYRDFGEPSERTLQALSKECAVAQPFRETEAARSA